MTSYFESDFFLPKLEKETKLKEVSKMHSQKLGEDPIAYELISG